MISVNSLNTPRTFYQPPVMKICRKVLLVLLLWASYLPLEQEKKSHLYGMPWALPVRTQVEVQAQRSHSICVGFIFLCGVHNSSICCSYEMLVICLIPVSVSSLVLGRWWQVSLWRATRGKLLCRRAAPSSSSSHREDALTLWCLKTSSPC